MYPESTVKSVNFLTAKNIRRKRHMVVNNCIWYYWKLNISHIILLQFFFCFVYIHHFRRIYDNGLTISRGLQHYYQVSLMTVTPPNKDLDYAMSVSSWCHVSYIEGRYSQFNIECICMCNNQTSSKKCLSYHFHWSILTTNCFTIPIWILASSICLRRGNAYQEIVGVSINVCHETLPLVVCPAM